MFYWGMLKILEKLFTKAANCEKRSQNGWRFQTKSLKTTKV